MMAYTGMDVKKALHGVLNFFKAKKTFCFEFLCILVYTTNKEALAARRLQEGGTAS